jgi:acyl-coenzyme A thioesterase PaaI-like protein
MGVTRAATAFDEATAAVRAGPGRYAVHPDRRFTLPGPDGNGPGPVNGGVLMATVLRAVLDSSPHPYPVATSAHFLRVASPAPAGVEVSWLKRGRTAATAHAQLIQDSQPVMDVTVVTGQLSGAQPGGLSWTSGPPRLPPIGDCVELGPWQAGTAPGSLAAGYPAQVEIRLDPATTGWQRGEPSGVPEMRGYFRLREQRDPDAYLLAVAVDGLPPVVFGLGAYGWSPTVQLTWHMRTAPGPGPLRVATRCRHVGSGWFDEEAEVWDSAGHLVAQSRQLARLAARRR